METWINYYSSLYPNTSVKKLEKTFIKEVKKKNEIVREERKNENQKTYKGQCFYIFS